MQRRFAIADVRGELNLLKKLMDKIAPTIDDSIVFLGSYLGPGSDSKGVLDYLIAFRKKLPNTIFLMGCYEWAFGHCISENPSLYHQKIWGDMNGGRVFKSYADDKKLIYMSGKGTALAEIPLKIPEPHIRFMQETEPNHWYEDGVFPFVLTHNGGHPTLYGRDLSRPEEIVFGENNWWLQDGRQIPNKTVVFSHVPFRQPFRRAGKLGIDLGAGFSGKLAAFDMMADSVVIVS
jgi:serine/threonine protein phosphatase 1